MKIIILGASFDNYNLGVGALATGVVTCIDNHWPGAQLFLLTFAQKPTVFEVPVGRRKVTVRTINLRMKPHPGRNAVLLVATAFIVGMIPGRRLRSWLIGKISVLRCVQDGSLIVSIAGGDSFSDIYGLRRLVDIALPQVLALLLRKPLILLPQTIGPFQTRIARVIARVLMRRAALIYSRDNLSLQVATEMTSRTANSDRVRFCYDVAFVLEPRKPEHIDVAGVSLERNDRNQLVGLNISGLLFAGGYRRNDAFGFREKYVAETTQVVDLLITRKNARVLLVPHTLGTGTESDSNVCAALYDSLKDRHPGYIGLVRGTYTAAEMKYIIGRCDFFIGARMHACIAALSQGIPAIAFAYSRKFAGVLETLGLGELVIDPKATPGVEVLRLVSRHLDAASHFRKVLRTRLPEIRDTVLGLCREIDSIMARPVAGNEAIWPPPVSDRVGSAVEDPR